MKKTLVTFFAITGIASAADVGSSSFTGGNTFKADSTYGQLTLNAAMTTGNDTDGIGITFSPNVDILSPNSKGGRYFADDYTVSLWVETASLSSNQVLFGYCCSWSSNTTGYNGLTWNATDKTLTVGRGEWKDAENKFNYQGGDNQSTTTSLESYLSGKLTNITLAVQNVLADWGHQQVDVWINGQKVETLNRYFGDMTTTEDNYKGIQYFVEQGAKYGTISITNEYLTTAESIASLAGARIVPEPTTATLSLLALAGLAARRRRK